MEKLTAWLDGLSVKWMLPLALMLGVAPWPANPGATPHSVEKLQMLMAGTLVRPLDIFDLFMHTTPLLILIVIVARRLKARSAKPSP